MGVHAWCVAECYRPCPPDKICGKVCCIQTKPLGGIAAQLVFANPSRNLCSLAYKNEIDCGGVCCPSVKYCNDRCCGTDTACFYGACVVPPGGTTEACLLKGGTGSLCTPGAGCGRPQLVCGNDGCCYLVARIVELIALLGELAVFIYISAWNLQQIEHSSKVTHFLSTYLI